ncbi:MAG: ribonuclease D [Acidiferrobacterales bacterium]|nr:ribonuclease D [Acidiferrobacterales bacterium]
MNHLIERQDQLNKLASIFNEVANQSGLLAVDTEFLREKTYSAKLCLVQLGIGQDQYCIDVLAIEDLSSLKDLLIDENIIKIFHAARQDIEVIYQTLGVIPKPIFDTQLAAAFCGKDMQIGYGAIVEAELEVALAKSQSRTDWTKRPLSKEQLEYAADDVAYLEPLYEKLLSDLKHSNRYAWYLEEISDYYNADLYVVEPSKAYHRLSGANLKLSHQYILKALAEWRERTAQQRDIPRTWVLKDDRLFDLAIKQPSTIEDLKKLGIFGAKSIKHWGKEVLKIIAEVEIGNQEIWNRVEPLSREQKGICSKMMKELKSYSEQNKISQGLLGTRRDIEGLFRHGESRKLQKGWRNELVGKPLATFLEAI